MTGGAPPPLAVRHVPDARQVPYRSGMLVEDRAAAAEPVQLPELIEVLKEHLAGTSPAELNKAAVTGLLVAGFGVWGLFGVWRLLQAA